MKIHGKQRGGGQTFRVVRVKNSQHYMSNICDSVSLRFTEIQVENLGLTLTKIKDLQLTLRWKSRIHSGEGQNFTTVHVKASQPIKKWWSKTYDSAS